MTTAAITLAIVALAVSFGNAWHTRRAHRRARQAADFRWRDQ